MLFCDRLDGIRVAEIAVDVHRDDRGGLGRDKRLDLRGVHRVGRGVDVAEHGFEPVSRDRVRRGDEGEGRRDHFACEPHGGDDRLEREVAVREQGHLLRAEVVLKRSLELLMFFTHVGQPVAVPQGFELFQILLKGRKRGFCDVDVGHGSAFQIIRFVHLCMICASFLSTRYLFQFP